MLDLLTSCKNAHRQTQQWSKLEIVTLADTCAFASHAYPFELRGRGRTRLLVSINQGDFQKGRKLFGDIFFFSLFFFWISGSHHFPWYLQHFGAGNCHFHGMCNGFEFEPLIFHCIFHGICNSMSMFCPFSMLFAAFLSWNLHFHRMCNILQLHSSQYLQDFGAEG